jgi:HAD superfamily hydrolase (TIGR01509 family)
MERLVSADRLAAARLRAVLLDLDGVLVDSRRATAEFFRGILSTHGYPVPSQDRCDTVYHLPAVAALAELGQERDPAQLAVLARAVAREAYPMEFLRLERDAAGMLMELAGRYRLGIVSSRLRAGIVDVIDAMLERQLFEVVIGFEDTEHHKPHPAPLVEAMARLNVAPRETVYVGDSDSDIIAAREAGTFSVRFGSGGAEEADVAITRLSELVAVLPAIRADGR